MANASRRPETLTDRPADAAEVLAALRHLAARVANPVVKQCLHDARRDIAHLTALEEGPDLNLLGEEE
jgi:hypothetical protein